MQLRNSTRKSTEASISFEMMNKKLRQQRKHKRQLNTKVKKLKVNLVQCKKLIRFRPTLSVSIESVNVPADSDSEAEFEETMLESDSDEE